MGKKRNADKKSRRRHRPWLLLRVFASIPQFPIVRGVVRVWQSVFVQTYVPVLEPLYPRRDGIGLALLFIGVLTLYAASTPRTVMLEDDGLFIVTSVYAGVAHPPGYPLYVLLGWLASHLPFGSVAWRIHTACGVMGALTCVLIAWLVIRRTGNRPAAYMAGAALAVSEHFWSQAIIADVYTTNTAVLFLTVVLLQEAMVRQDRRCWLAAAGCYGLGLANHWPLFILGSPVLLAYAVTAGKEFWKRVPGLVLVTLAVAALLYGWVVWRSHQPLVVNFVDPIQSWDEFIHFIRRDRYTGIDTSINADITDKLLYARYFSTQLLLQFSVLGGLVAVGGAIAAYRPGRRLYLIGEVATLIGSSYLLIGLLDFDYEYIRVALFRPYPLVAYCIFALWLGYGAHALMQMAPRRERLVPPVMVAASVLLITGLCLWNGRSNYRPDDTFAADQAGIIFDLIEKDAVYVASADSALPMIYLHLIEGKRPDMRLLEHDGFVLNDRIVHQSWSWEQRKQAWDEFIRATSRPVYYSVFGRDFPNTSIEHYGFVKKVTTDTQPGIWFKPSEVSKQAFRQIVSLPATKDSWVRFHSNQMTYIYGFYLGKALTVNNPELNAHIKDIIPLAEENYSALISMATSLLQTDTPENINTADNYIQKFKQLPDVELTKIRQAFALFLEGYIAEKKNNISEAITLFKASIAIHKGTDNQAHKALKGTSKNQFR